MVLGINHNGQANVSELSLGSDLFIIKSLALCMDPLEKPNEARDPKVCVNSTVVGTQ